MNSKQIRHIVQGHYKRIKGYSDDMAGNVDKETIHRFRVEYKKLRAFLRMLSHVAPVDKMLTISGPLKKAYMLTGTIRDLQLQQQRIREATGDKPKKPISYLNLLEREIESLRPALEEVFNNHTIRESWKKTSAFLPPAFPATRFKSYANKNWLAIRSILVWGHLNDEAIHRVRKLLKDLFYNLNNYKGLEKELLTVSICKEKPEVYFKELLDELGSFQDRCTSIALLKTYWLEHLGAYNQVLLQQLKKKWINEKMKQKLFLQNKLRIELLPLATPNKTPAVNLSQVG